ncbi:MAG: formylglycine-generating enzyme family protein, partial [Chloroflexi bacterium]|nr:formylglycine-generating enzyme family protein [Chloroflexota bacterium]
AAVHLARLGDPRAEAMAVDGMQFCLIPKGAFWMGDGERGSNKLHQVAIPYDYWLGRYPVTNAQFQAFVEDGGYAQERYWREAQRQGHWRDGQVDAYVWRAGKHERGRRDRPNDYGRPFNLPNHPVVGVTWYEGVAFTRWLTERWRKSGLLAPKMRLALPSEAEWEKAARGGLETVSEPAIVIPESDRWTQTAATIPNPSPQRRYPTGEEQITSEQANFDNAEIGATSGAGCFSSGKSAYGCEEMSGNVWEWTQSAHKSYPYQADDGREALAEYTTRVLRGGAYYSDFTALRCASRYSDLPHLDHYPLGFRVVASPFIPPTADR